MNREYATEIINKILTWGVEEFYVCAGARDIPLIEVVCQIKSKSKIIYNHFEERSASFYALGRIKNLNKPIAVITTSGTAVAELLPAVMEAYYSGLPLVLITADRPKSYRESGAPQSAIQKNIFGIYVSECFDLEINDAFDLSNIKKNKPIHINVCFDIPLQSGKLTQILKPIIQNNDFVENTLPLNENIKILQNFIHKSHKTLIIISQLFDHDKTSLIEFILKMNCPVYLESISNIREIPELEKLRLKCGDKIWLNSKACNYEFDSVIKIGCTPTHRLWRDLDETKKHIKVLSISTLPFSGMPNAIQIATNLNTFFSNFNKILVKKETSIEAKKLIDLDNACYVKLKDLFLKYPDAEQSLYYNFSKKIHNNSRVYIGNSLPIRYWDCAATFEFKNFIVNASRGLNGIDGQISTFLGFADESAIENWGIFGDLTTMYDFAGLWMIQQRPLCNTNIVIINNGGGRIFEKVISGEISSICQNEHAFNFEYLAKFWKLEYEKVTNVNLIAEYNKQRIIEVIPDRDQSNLFSLEYNKF